MIIPMALHGFARLTLAFPVLSNAARVYVLVSGGNKARALERALAPAGHLLTCPARGLRPTDGELVWWTDRDAASLVRQRQREGSR